MTANFNYFHTEDIITLNNFICFPTALLTSDKYKKLSNDAKLLFSLMLDRTNLSIANKWIDEDSNVYIYFSVQNITELLNCSKTKALRLLNELDIEKGGVGLIKKKRQGLGRPCIIYINKIILEESISDLDTVNSTDSVISSEKISEVSESYLQNTQNQTSASIKSEFSELSKSESNHTKDNHNEIIHTYINQTESNQTDTVISDENSGIDLTDREHTLIHVKQQISYSLLILRYEVKLIDEITDIITDVLYNKNQKYNIKSTLPNEDNVSPSLVRFVFKMLKYKHVFNIADKLANGSFNIINCRSYIITALYNSIMKINTRKSALSG